jgi:hypothetical protein
VRGCWCGYWDNVLSRRSSSQRLHAQRYPRILVPIVVVLCTLHDRCHLGGWAVRRCQGCRHCRRCPCRHHLVLAVLVLSSSSSSSSSPSSSSPADPGPASGPGHPVIVVADAIVFFYWPISLSYSLARCRPRSHFSCRPVVAVSPSLSSNSSWSPSLPSASSSGLSFHPASSCSQRQLGLLLRWWHSWTWACCFGVVVSL